MNLREAAQQALEALENLDEQELASGDMVWLGKEIGDLRVALTEDVPETMPQPVAYVTGFTKGRCTIQLVDPDWLPPVGMALYRSPPTYQESRQVEPVAWITPGQDLHLVNYEGFQDWTPLYTAQPKREPLTD